MLSNSYFHRFGARLTKISMVELTRFKYSNFRAIKLNCPNLQHLTIAITGKSLFTSLNHIVVEQVQNCVQIH